MESITLFFQRLVVRDNLEECIGFLISHWNVSNVLAKYATPSWESDDRSRCFVLYSMNSELSWSDSPELGCSHSLVLDTRSAVCVWSCGRSTAKRRLFSCSFTGTKDENLMFLLLVCYRYHFTYRYTHGWDIPAVAQKIHKQNSGRIGLHSVIAVVCLISEYSKEYLWCSWNNIHSNIGSESYFNIRPSDNYLY